MSVAGRLETPEWCRDQINRYLNKRQLYPFQITEEPSASLGLTVVIPCFDEPDIDATLQSLSLCLQPEVDVEVIVIVNAPEGAAATVIAELLEQDGDIDAAKRFTGHNDVRALQSAYNAPRVVCTNN